MIILGRGMSRTAPSPSGGWTLEETLARLIEHERVEGLLTIGSLAREALAAGSDYDLVIVLRDAAPPWYVGLTQIAGRLTDLIFVPAVEIDRLLALDAPIPAGHELAPVMRWVETGRIVHDRSGRLDQAQRRVREQRWVEPIDDQAAHAAWFAINYNLAQARRMLAVDDPLYRTTASIRMALYGHMDLWFGYWNVRQIPFRGDKEAVRDLQARDPAFLDAYRRFLDETAPDKKLALYERAAALAAAPLGGLWPAGHTAMNVDGALQAWQDLLGEKNVGQM